MFKTKDIKFANSSSIDDFYSPPKVVTSGPKRIRVASANDLKGFIRLSHDKLVHVSQQDFWKLAKDEDTGDFFIERIADDLDGPVKG